MGKKHRKRGWGKITKKKEVRQGGDGGRKQLVRSCSACRKWRQLVTQKHPFLFQAAKQCCHHCSKKGDSHYKPSLMKWWLIIIISREQTSAAKFKFKLQFIASVPACVTILTWEAQQKSAPVWNFPLSCLSIVIYLFMHFYLEMVKDVVFFCPLNMQLNCKIRSIRKDKLHLLACEGFVFIVSASDYMLGLFIFLLHLISFKHNLR